MIEARIGESGCVVAIFAAIARLWVAGCFAQGFLAVVACDARFRNAAMIEPADRPFICCVAGIAFALGCYVIGIFASRPDIVMAACASCGSAFKHAALVAGFASNLRMPSR